MKTINRIFLSCLPAIIVQRAAAQAAEFIPLGFLPNNTSTEARAVSADGGVVVGTALGSSTRAFRWTPVDGMQALGNLPGRTHSYGLAVSADGSVIAGISHTSGSHQACRWNAAGQMQLLGGLAGLTQAAHRASAPTAPSSSDRVSSFRVIVRRSAGRPAVCSQSGTFLTGRSPTYRPHVDGASLQFAGRRYQRETEA